MAGGCGALERVSKDRFSPTGVVVMVAMVALCGTRISNTCLLVHIVGGNLAGGVEEVGNSSSRRFSRVVDFVLCYRFDVRKFGLIHGFNCDDFSSRALILRGTHMKTFQLSSITSG
jgi:hypothetical protein